MPMSVQERTMKAAAASSRAAKVRRFKRYLKEMRADGLDVTVTRREADGVFAVVPEYASPRSH